MKRRYPIGAERVSADEVNFRVWAPKCRTVAVQLCDSSNSPTETKVLDLTKERDGYFSGSYRLPEDTKYRFLLDEDFACPDPASRFQPEGPHGPSQLVNSNFEWSDHAWRGIGSVGQVAYEMHVGTFTAEGTWRAATNELPYLAELGITVIEVMPVADFPGTFGWGYDGVNLFAPTRLYGEPDDLRRFIDAAHCNGIGVILDVVYNHFGPDGNYISRFSDSYISSRYQNEWGESINFDDEKSGPVREFFETNAVYWIEEFHFDGLRFDATQAIFDASDDNILSSIERKVRIAAGDKKVFLVAENESQHTHLVRPQDQGGNGLDALWNDDFHHTALVALTGKREAYYTDYKGSPQEFISAAKWGYLYQGQRYAWQKKRRGTLTFDLEPSAFVNFLENHDQIANSGTGMRPRSMSSPARYRALTALMMLSAATPMLFQGQEFGASSPFFYFADHTPELNALVFEGRKKFLKQFPSVSTADMQELITDPSDPKTFTRSKLDLRERESHAEILALHRDLIALRKNDTTVSAQRAHTYDGAVLTPEAFVIRMFGGGEPSGHRLLVINLGPDATLEPAPEPLLAPPPGMQWSLLWSSEDPKYGGNGLPPPDEEEIWRLLRESAAVYSPVPYTNAETAES